MPLSPPVPRAPIHRRVIDCQGYRRDDGLWDIEARLVDTKSYGFSNSYRPRVEPGEPLHEMLIRLTLDESYTIKAIECASDHTPHGECGAILPNFQRLVGLTIGPGFNKKVKLAVGGAEGCAHHGELLRVLATVAFQTMGPLLARQNKAAGVSGESVASGNFLINSCHIWREGGEWARLFREDPAGTLGNRQIPVETE
jgi:hypothetical protein